MLKIINTALKYGYAIKFKKKHGVIHIMCEKDGYYITEIIVDNDPSEYDIVNAIANALQKWSKKELITKKK